MSAQINSGVGVFLPSCRPLPAQGQAPVRHPALRAEYVSGFQPSRLCRIRPRLGLILFFDTFVFETDHILR